MSGTVGACDVPPGSGSLLSSALAHSFLEAVRFIRCAQKVEDDGMTETPASAVSKHGTSMIWIIVATVCIGSFMGQLDASITQLVLPALERKFAVSVGQVSWVAVMFLLVVSVML